jgi:catechol 2,3-dioxygenase-like lactoylglutathione lyase family enzyme
MPRVVGIDHLVLSVGDFARSQNFYDKLLVFLGFKRKYDYADMTGSGSPPPTRKGGSTNIARAISASTTMRSSLRAATMSTRSAPFWKRMA